MKEYFIRLFEYDRYANEIILETITKANNPQKPVKLMAHLLAAQQIWLNRCLGSPAPGGALWPDAAVDTFAAQITENSGEFINYLSMLQSEDFEKPLLYKNLKGEDFENKLSDVLAHVINHGTHHRAQAGQHLITAGIEKLPPTDYIFYMRTLNYR
jgi:uncharacterized damage-inducible protein DinB